MSDKHNSKYAVEMHNVSKIYTLKTKDKTKKKERFYALKDVSFQVEKGDVVGILGTNGSGKSMLLRTIAGLIKPSKGKVWVDGKPLGDHRQRRTDADLDQYRPESAADR